MTERVLAKAPCPVLTIPPGSPKVVPRAKPLFRNVLCPVDFSPSSRAALTYVEGLAREPGSALTVLHVVERLPSFQLVLHRAIPDALRRAAAVNEVVSEGDAGDEILAAAGTSHCDLIVMGAHAGHGLLGFGSTTNHVIRHATCPVLTLKA